MPLRATEATTVEGARVEQVDLSTLLVADERTDDAGTVERSCGSSEESQRMDGHGVGRCFMRHVARRSGLVGL
jgi:hypothetical protein